MAGPLEDDELENTETWEEDDEEFNIEDDRVDRYSGDESDFE